MLDNETLAKLREMPNGELLGAYLEADARAKAAALAEYEAKRWLEHVEHSVLDRLRNSECRERAVVHAGHAFMTDGNRLNVRTIVEMPRRFPHY